MKKTSILSYVLWIALTLFLGFGIEMMSTLGALRPFNHDTPTAWIMQILYTILLIISGIRLAEAK